MKFRESCQAIGHLMAKGLPIVCIAVLSASAPFALAQGNFRLSDFSRLVDDDHVRAELVQRRWRPSASERARLKAMEEYYDDLEDFYDDRNPQLADYFESLENYYEDLRKGRAAYLPPQMMGVPAPGIVQPAPPGLPPTVQQEFRVPSAVLPTRRELQQRVLQPHDVLVRAYGQLQTDLAQLTTGERWQRYLSLPLDTSPDEDFLDRLHTERGRNVLESALEKYNRVQRNEQYDVVTRLGSFRRTHDALKSLLGWLARQPVPASIEALPPPEEIPLPQASSPGKPREESLTFGR